MAEIAVKRTILVKRKDLLARYKTERFLIFFVFFFTLIMENFALLSSSLSVVKFINDIAVICLFVLSINKVVPTFKKLKCMPILYAMIAFSLVSILSAIVNLVPINMFVWGARNTFRGMIFFIAIVCFLDGIDINKIYKYLFYFAIVNFVLVLFQYFVLGYAGDKIGGIFGLYNSTVLGVFNTILYSYFFVSYVKGKESFIKTLFVLLSAMIITALAEEKFGFLFCAVALIITLCIKGDWKRKIYLSLSVIFSIAIGLVILKLVFPFAFQRLTSIKDILFYSKATYEEGYKIPRLGGILYINENFFKGDILKLFFGFGFGNCDTSNFSLFQSNFYKLYGDYNYRWFSHQWVFMEGGLTGIICFVAIFITALVCILRRIKKDNNSVLFCVGLILALYVIITIWLGSILKHDNGYLLYFALSIGLIALKPKAYVKKNAHIGERNDT